LSSPPGGITVNIPGVGRLLFCAWCLMLVLICPWCDRGNTCCCREHARARRLESNRRAGAKYRRTPAGRENNAARQRRFRQRQRQTVTQQGSPPVPVETRVEATVLAPVLQEPAAGPTRADGAGVPAPIRATPEEPRHDAKPSARPAPVPLHAAPGDESALIPCSFCARLCHRFVRWETFKCRARPFGRSCPERRRRDRPPARCHPTAHGCC
jgi:hypothetical protein